MTVMQISSLKGMDDLWQLCIFLIKFAYENESLKSGEDFPSHNFGRSVSKRSDSTGRERKGDPFHVLPKIIKDV